MRRSFVALVLVVALVGLGSSRRAMLLSKKAPDSSITYLINENFDAPGFEITSPNAWVSSGTVLSNSTVFPVNGTSGLELRRVGANASASIYWPDIGPGTNLQQVGVFTAVATTITNLTAQLFAIQTNGTTKGFVRVNSNARIQIWDSAGAVSASPADAVSTNSVFYVWAFWNHAAGTGDVEWATTPVKLGSGSKYAALTGGQTGMQVNQLTLLADRTGQTNYNDYVRVHTNGISSNP